MLAAPTLLAPAGLLVPTLGIGNLSHSLLTTPSLEMGSLPVLAIPSEQMTPLSVSAVPEAQLNPTVRPAGPAKRGALPSLRSIEKAAKGNERGNPSRQAARSFAAAFDGNAADPTAVDSLGDELDSYRVKPSQRRSINLSDYDANDTGSFEKNKKSKKKALKLLRKETTRLQELQQRLYAEGKRKVLVVFQAPDTGGKDGTIRWVIGPLNPQGVQVSSFKKPTQEEASHHYLWRIKKALPKPGMFRIFNRSHYEDILVPTVLKTEDSAVIEGRYEELAQFEKEMAKDGVTIVKFFLNISKDEQKRRLQSRLDDPKKHWKFDKGDLEARALWEQYRAVYEKILARTSKPWAPWFVIPSNNKWYRSLVVSRILRKTLEAMNPQFPPPMDGLEDIVIPD